MPRVVRRRAIHRQSQRDTGRKELSRRRNAGSQAQVGRRAPRHGSAGPGNPLDVIAVEVHAVGEPDIRPQPLQIIQQLQRPAPKYPLAILLFVNCLGDVRVQPHAGAPGQCGRFAHQPRCNGKWRARRDGYTHHGARTRIVPPPDRVFGLREDGIGVLHDRIRRQPALAGAEIHRAAARMEAHSDLPGDVDLGVQNPPDAVGKDVVVIGGGGTSRQG